MADGKTRQGPKPALNGTGESFDVPTLKLLRSIVQVVPNDTEPNVENMARRTPRNCAQSQPPPAPSTALSLRINSSLSSFASVKPLQKLWTPTTHCAQTQARCMRDATEMEARCNRDGCEMDPRWMRDGCEMDARFAEMPACINLAISQETSANR